MDNNLSSSSSSLLTKRKYNSNSSRIKSSFEELLQDHLYNILEQDDFVVIITGAGLSISSGIPSYRGSKNAIWDTSIKEWGTKTKFLKDPLLWYNSFFLPKFAKQSVINAKPNQSHYSISKLQQKYSNLLLVTQNIDKLHINAGSPLSQVIQIHGQLDLYKCLNTNCIYSNKKSIIYSNEDLQDIILNNNNNTSDNDSYITFKSVPLCPLCHSIVMPQVLLFDETYESHEFYEISKAKEWFDKCKLMIFIGTSHAVAITHTAEQIGYSNQIKLYNINPNDTINGMTNIKINAEILLPDLSNYILYNNENIYKKQKLCNNNNNNTYKWIKLNNNDNQWLKKHSIIQQLYINRCISLYSIDNINNNSNIYIFKDNNDNNNDNSNILYLFYIIFNGIGSLIGNFTMNNDLYNFICSKCLYNNEYIIYLDSLINILDNKISMRNVSRISNISLIPKSLYSFIKRKEKDKTNNYNIDFYIYLGFYFDKDVFTKIKSESYKIQINNEKYEYIGKLNKKKMYLLEINEKIWNIILEYIYPNMKILYKSFNNYKDNGGIGFCIVDKLLFDDINDFDNIKSFCISSYIGDNNHNIILYTNPKYRNKGLASSCAYIYIYHCMNNDIIPNWCCKIQESQMIKIALKLGYNPIVTIPALYIKNKKKE